jgi:hypothetical protein
VQRANSRNTHVLLRADVFARLARVEGVLYLLQNTVLIDVTLPQLEDGGSLQVVVRQALALCGRQLHSCCVGVRRQRHACCVGIVSSQANPLLSAVSLPRLRSGAYLSFSGCSALASVDLPALELVGLSTMASPTNGGGLYFDVSPFVDISFVYSPCVVLFGRRCRF